jgi:hypothetical protein
MIGLPTPRSPARSIVKPSTPPLAPSRRSPDCRAGRSPDHGSRSRARGRRDIPVAARGSRHRRSCSRPPRPPGWRIPRPLRLLRVKVSLPSWLWLCRGPLRIGLQGLRTTCRSPVSSQMTSWPFAADPADLQASAGKLVAAPGRRAVDHHSADVQPSSRGECRLERLRMNSALQPERRPADDPGLVVGNRAMLHRSQRSSRADDRHEHVLHGTRRLLRPSRRNLAGEKGSDIADQVSLIGLIQGCQRRKHGSEFRIPEPVGQDGLDARHQGLPRNQ